MKINTNVAAMNALRNMNNTSDAASRQIEKLSSGYRLNRSADDAAGMGIANSLRSTGKGLAQAQRNASQAGSLLQIADGATQTVSSVLDRMKELATESATANVTDTDRQKINAEFTSLKSEINRIVGSTVYQGSKLLDGSFGVQDAGTGTANGQLAISNISVNGAAVNKTYTIAKVDATHISLSDGALTQTLVSAATGKQNFNFDKLGVSFTFNGDPTAAIGAAGAGGLDAATIITSNTTASSFRVGDGAVSDSDNLVAVSLGDLTTASTGLNLATATVDTSANATTALASIATAVGKVNTVIGSIGAAANRLDYAQQNVSSLYQNIAAAESTIRDADMAQEYTQYSKLQILQQAGTAMLAQANSSSQSVLTLLRG